MEAFAYKLSSILEWLVIDSYADRSGRSRLMENKWDKLVDLCASSKQREIALAPLDLLPSVLE